MEGPDQRPASRRLEGRQPRTAHRPSPAARGHGPRPGGRLRVPGPDHAAVHLGRGGVGRDRCPNDGEPDPPPARLRPLDAGRAAAGPHAFAGVDVSGTPAILYTEGNPDCHVILRGGKGAPNYDPENVAET